MYKNKDYIIKYRMEHREEAKAYQIKYRLNNKKKIKNSKIKYYLKNAETIKKKSKTYSINHKHIISKYQHLYYLEHKEKIKKYAKMWSKNHPENKLRSSIKRLVKFGSCFNMKSMEYKYALNSWSKTVKNLDNNTCKFCNSKQNLNAHHIQPKQLFPELSLDLDNGITLCNKCHGKLHGFDLY